MRALTVFKSRHQFAWGIFYKHLWEEYSEAQLRHSIAPSVNSLAWILWHVARVEDAGVMRFVAKQPQVFEEDDWRTRMRMPVLDFGYEMTYPAMRELSKVMVLGEVKAYAEAVRERVFAVLDDLTPAQLDEPLSEQEVEDVMVIEQVGSPAVGTNVPYAGWTRLEALFHFSVTHYYWHGGEVRTIEGLMRAAARQAGRPSL